MNVCTAEGTLKVTRLKQRWVNFFWSFVCLQHSSRTNLYIRGLPKSMSENDLVSLVPDASAIRSVKLVVNNDGEGKVSQF